MAKLRDFWVRAALALALALPLYFVGAAFSVKYGLIDWRFGFGTMTIGWGPLLLLGAAGFALIGLLLAVLTPPRRGWVSALVALLIPVAGLGYAGHVRTQAADIPPIHDIATDPADPPGFSAGVLAARAEANPIDQRDTPLKDHPVYAKRAAADPAFAAKTVSQLQAEAYPDIAPIRLKVAPDQAFAAADAAVRALGWTPVATIPADGVIEARTESFWYGFVDDIVIRVRAAGPGEAVVDVRSVSRVGVSDLGANAARIRSFKAELESRLAG